MNQCLNKLLESFNQIYEVTFQNIIEIHCRAGIIRPYIRKPIITTFELQPIDQSLKQPLTLHSSSSTPVFTKNESIYRRAESEKEFKKCIIPNLGDTINKVECYSKDLSILNLFDEKQELNHNTNQLDNNNIRNQQMPIIEENKVSNNIVDLEYEELKNNQNHVNNYIQNQQQYQNSQEQISQDQFYSIIDNPNKITQSEQFFSIIDRSSFRQSFNQNITRK